jgi:hypothetical protein
MQLGTIPDLVKALGGQVSTSYACALKRAAGLNGTRYFDVQAAVRWREEHPTWKMTDVYPNRQLRNTGQAFRS